MNRIAFANVWDAISDTPLEAANLTMRAEIMIAIETRVKSWNVTQKAAAERLGITQPRLNDLLRGKIDSFSLDALVALAYKIGLRVRLEIADAA